MKRISGFLSVLIILALAFSSILIGCSSRPEEDDTDRTEQESTVKSTADKTEKPAGGKVSTLYVSLTTSEETLQNCLKEIASDFEKQNPDVKVDFSFPGQEYENIMKIKMAANDLPDVFDTRLGHYPVWQIPG